MLAVQGYYDGAAIRLLEKIVAKPNQRVIVTVLDDFVEQKDELSKEERKILIKKERGSLPQYAKKGKSIDEIMELESKAWEQAATEKYGKGNGLFDAFAGDMAYIADDFDETPDCFKEYV